MRFFTAAAFFVTTIFILVNPAEGGPVAEANPKADPEPGGGDLLDLDVLLALDLSGLGKLLNALLKIIIGLGNADKCKYKDYALQLQGFLVDLDVYVNLLGIEVQVNLLIILGPLLEAVIDLVKALLEGLSINLSIVINLCLNILVQLNLELDLDVALQLGNLLNLDVLALLKLG